MQLPTSIRHNFSSYWIILFCVKNPMKETVAISVTLTA